MRIIGAVRSLVIVVLVTLCLSGASLAQIGVSIRIGPPPLPVYEQPLCPGEGYIWTPGYWAYNDDAGEYYWVPGTWVLAPEPGFLWTPPWWGWEGGVFLFHGGYWGPHVGFYGGIAYGFGYTGFGYEGGRWEGNRFFYNRTVNNVNVTNIHNTYNTTIINNNTTINRVSYNGGGGISRRPTPEEENAGRERHVTEVAAQREHVESARANRDLRESVNHGRPAIAATDRPGDFKGRVVQAKEAGAPYRAPAERRAEPNNANPAGGRANNVPRPGHAKDIQPHERPAAPNTGNAKRDQQYQQQQSKLYSKMDQQHQKLQQKQDQEHQRVQQQHANDAKMQQLEQKHERQTQQLEQRHDQQVQKLQQKEARPPHK